MKGPRKQMKHDVARLLIYKSSEAKDRCAASAANVSSGGEMSEMEEILLRCTAARP